MILDAIAQKIKKLVKLRVDNNYLIQDGPSW